MNGELLEYLVPSQRMEDCKLIVSVNVNNQVVQIWMALESSCKDHSVVVIFGWYVIRVNVECKIRDLGCFVQKPAMIGTAGGKRYPRIMTMRTVSLRWIASKIDRTVDVDRFDGMFTTTFSRFSRVAK